jgi:hypothetical protein
VELHDGSGWRASGLNVSQAILPWVRRNVGGSGGLRKFATNLAYFFEQAEFDVDTTGHLITYGNHWGPLALQLFFDRYTIHRPAADADELVAAARQHEIHRLLGLDAAWLDSVIDGAAITYLSPNRHTLIATQESITERTARPSGPAGRRTVLVSRLVRSTRNVVALKGWYGGVCQICGYSTPGSQGESSVDYAHIQPLGAPHNGPDGVENMLSLCPNHHRQIDRGGIAIDPASLQILAPHGSAPRPRTSVMLDSNHLIDKQCLQYHRDRIFNH